MKNYKKTWTRHPRKISLSCKGTGMLRLENRHVRTGKEHVGITATPNQTIEADGSWNSLATMSWWWQTHLAPTKHPEKSPGTAQTERHTTKLTTSWWRNNSKQVWTLPRPEASQEPTFEATMRWSWWPSSYIWRGWKKSDTRIRFEPEKLKGPEVAEIFWAKIGGKFAALSILNSDMDMDMLTDTFNTAVTDTANEILGTYRPVKKPWATTDSLDLCAKWRKLKNKKNNKDRDEMAQYRAVNQEIKKGMKKAKGNWIGEQCQHIDDCLKNNSNKAYKLVQDLTGTNQSINQSNFYSTNIPGVARLSSATARFMFKWEVVEVVP